MSSMKEKLHTGELYLPGDDEIVEDQTKRLDRLYDYNMTRPTEGKKREEMLKEMFAEIGEGCYIEPPLHANMGGASDPAGTQREVLSVQYAGPYRKMLLDRCRCDHSSWCHDRRQHGHRRGKCCDEGYPGKCGGSGKSLPGLKGDQ